MMPEDASSASNTPKKSRRISGSAEGESSTNPSSPSQFQQPIGLPPLPPPPPRPTTAFSPGSQPHNRKRTTSLRTQIPQPSSINSQTVQESGPQEKPTNGSRVNDDVHQYPPLPEASPDLGIIRELFPVVEQGLGTRQALTQGLMEALCFYPHSSSHVRRTMTQPHWVPGNGIDPFSPESVSSNDSETGRRANNQVTLSQMIFSRFAPEDDDPEYDLWVGPPPGYYKLNVAVTFCYSGGAQMLGLGAIVRDNFGVAQAAVSLLLNNLNPGPAESLIFDMGIAFSLLWGFDRLIAETESPLLVQQYRAFAQNAGLHFENFSFFYARRVRRNANTVAHRFAGMAPLVESVFWSAQDIADYFGSNSMPF